jgi:hypothetical protein
VAALRPKGRQADDAEQPRRSAHAGLPAPNWEEVAAAPLWIRPRAEAAGAHLKISEEEEVVVRLQNSAPDAHWCRTTHGQHRRNRP